MSDHFFRTDCGRGIITLANIFRYGGFTFEWHNYCGPIKCRKDGEPSNAKTGDKFYRVAQQFHELPKEEQEKHRIYG